MKERLIRVESQFCPESNMFCCGEPAEQRQINYKLTIGGERFSVPKVWASVCQVNPIDDVYFQLEVAEEISDRIFKRQHPMEYKISELQRQ